MRRIFVFCLAIWSVAAAHARAEPVHAPPSPPGVARTEAIVRDYLLNNPEILREAAGVLARRDQADRAARQAAALAQARDRLESDPRSPVLGNPDGDVTLVEFFDYRCPYCRRSVDDLARLVAADGRIRWVMKEMPVLGPASMVAARAALAAARQGRYEALHLALMRAPGRSDAQAMRETVLATARSAGLDIARLRADMRDDAISGALQDNLALAAELGITGTPSLVIGDRIIRGAVSPEVLRQHVAAARADAPPR